MFNSRSLNLNPDRKTLRQFGWIGLLGFALLARLAWRERAIFAFGLGILRLPLAGLFVALALLCVVFGLVWPRGNRPIYVGLTLLSFPIGWVVSHLALALMFAFVIGPIAIVMRLLRRDPLSRLRDDAAPSYWTRRETPSELGRYFRQF